MSDTDSSGTDRRNLSLKDFEYADYDQYLDDRIDTFLGHERVRVADRGFDYVIAPRSLFRHGLFGQLLNRVDSQPTRDEWNELKDADCKRCGEPDVGIYGLYDSVEGPDGERYAIHQEACLCDDCHGRVLDDLRQYGEVQPTMGVFA
jgi:hypothetical protein